MVAIIQVCDHDELNKLFTRRLIRLDLNLKYNYILFLGYKSIE